MCIFFSPVGRYDHHPVDLTGDFQELLEWVRISLFKSIVPFRNGKYVGEPFMYAAFNSVAEQHRHSVFSCGCNQPGVLL